MLPHVQIMLEALVVHATQDIQEMVSFAMVTIFIINVLFPNFNFYLFLDNNECTLGTHNCAPGIATCTNIPGSFTCACNEGYDGDGVTCEGKSFLYYENK